VTKVSEGSLEVNEFVNQQISISINLIMPLLMTMLTFSKLFLQVLFSNRFLVAGPLLNFTIAGTFILVVAWPIAYVFLAHRATKTYIFSETVGNLSMLVLCFWAVQSGHFTNIGLAYLLHYVIYLALIVGIFYRRFKGRIYARNTSSFFINAVLILAITLTRRFFGENITYIIGSLLITGYFYYAREEYIFMFRSLFRRK
jgi:PST family polysaccharide transporter